MAWGPRLVGSWGEGLWQPQEAGEAGGTLGKIQRGAQSAGVTLPGGARPAVAAAVTKSQARRWPQRPDPVLGSADFGHSSNFVEGEFASAALPGSRGGWMNTALLRLRPLARHDPGSSAPGSHEALPSCPRVRTRARRRRDGSGCRGVRGGSSVPRGRGCRCFPNRGGAVPKKRFYRGKAPGPARPSCGLAAPRFRGEIPPERPPCARFGAPVEPVAPGAAPVPLQIRAGLLGAGGRGSPGLGSRSCRSTLVRFLGAGGVRAGAEGKAPVPPTQRARRPGCVCS